MLDYVIDCCIFQRFSQALLCYWLKDVQKTRFQMCRKMSNFQKFAEYVFHTLIIVDWFHFEWQLGSLAGWERFSHATISCPGCLWDSAAIYSNKWVPSFHNVSLLGSIVNIIWYIIIYINIHKFALFNNLNIYLFFTCVLILWTFHCIENDRRRCRRSTILQRQIA